jgi:hypothetical protein
MSADTPHAELFFESDEQHIRCLLFEPNGNLIAGSDGGGLVYRIGKDRKGLVIYDAPKREVTALAESADGRLYVAAVGEKTKSTLPPLPVQGLPWPPRPSPSSPPARCRPPAAMASFPTAPKWTN